MDMRKAIYSMLEQEGNEQENAIDNIVKQYDELSTNYSTLQSDYTSLEGNYNGLHDEHELYKRRLSKLTTSIIEPINEPKEEKHDKAYYFNKVFSKEIK